MTPTSETLLERLKIENAHDAWKEFYGLYAHAILAYGRKVGLRGHEAEDVLQETMVVLMRLLPEFVYDRRKGRFRSFLLTIVHRKANRVFRLRQRTSDTHEPFDDAKLSPPDRPEADSPDAQAHARWRESLWLAALERLRSDPWLDERTLAVFMAYAVNHRPASEVARQFGLKENAVYQIKNRLLKRLQAEVRQMERSAGE